MVYTCYVPPEIWFMQGRDHEQERREREHIERYAAFAHIPSFFRKEAEVLVESSLQLQASRERLGGDWFFTDGRTDLRKKLPLRELFVTSETGEIEIHRVPRGEKRKLAPKDGHLFLDFTKLELFTLKGSDAGPLESFIKQYGFLGGDLTRYMTAPKDESKSDVLVGESYFDWASEILEMRYAVDLWRSLETKDNARLERFIAWEKVTAPRQLGYVSRLSRPREAYLEEEMSVINLRSERWLTWPLAVPDAERVWTNTLDQEKTFEAGWYFLKSWINQGLVGRTATQLDVPLKAKQLILTPTPTCLIGALWQQFANAVVRNDDIRICPICGESFPIRRTVDARMDKTYCRARCRVRGYRLRSGSRSENRSTRG